MERREDSFYTAYSYGDKLEEGHKLTLEHHMLQAVTLRQHTLCKTACLTFKVRRSRFFAITAKV